MRARWFHLLFALFAVAALGAAGCGDDDDNGDDAVVEDPLDDEEGDDGEEVSLSAELSGEAEVPGPGAEGASGSAEVTVSGTEVCLVAESEGVDEPFAAGHIHDGGSDEAGPVVVDFTDALTEDGADGCTDAPDVAADIAEDPSGFYVNLHTETFPDGAVRGQLG